MGTFKTDSHSSSTAVARRETAPVARAPARKGTAVTKAAAVKPKAKPGGDDDGEWEKF